MENSDAAFEAEADLISTRQRTQLAHRGERAAKVAKGGINVPVRAREDEYASESTPLITGEDESRDADGEDDGTDTDGKGSWSGGADFAHLPWYKRPSIFWLVGPFFLTTLAFGGVLPAKVSLLVQLICREYISEQEGSDPTFWMAPVDLNGDNAQCRTPAISARVATFGLSVSLITGLISAFTSPKLGGFSDRYGRKTILVVTSIGTICSEIISIVAATKPETFRVEWFLLAAALDGITGSFTVSIAMATSYAADCTPPSMRNVAFGLFHASLFTGLALGPILAGLVTVASGQIATVFWILLGVHLFFVLCVGLIIPESLSKKRQMAARERHQRELEQEAESGMDLVNKLRSLNLLAPLSIFWPTGPGSSRALRWNLVSLVAVDTIAFGVAMGSINVLLIYTSYQFGWGTFENSVMMSVVNGSRVFCLLIVLPLLTRLIRGKTTNARSKRSGSDRFDVWVIRVAIFFDTLGYLGYTLARVDGLMLASGAVAAIGGIGSPTLQSALTKHVPEDRTGQLLGASGQLHALSRVVAPTVFGAIYAATVGKFTQTVFVCLTATFGLAFVASWFIRPNVHYDEGIDERAD